MANDDCGPCCLVSGVSFESDWLPSSSTAAHVESSTSCSGSFLPFLWAGLIPSGVVASTEFGINFSGD